MGSEFGRIFRVSTFGESHGGAVGVVLDGCPPRLAIAPEFATLSNAWRRLSDAYGKIDPYSLEIEIRL